MRPQAFFASPFDILTAVDENAPSLDPKEAGFTVIPQKWDRRMRPAVVETRTPRTNSPVREALPQEFDFLRRKLFGRTNLFKAAPVQ
jgi:hypothetical protein